MNWRETQKTETEFMHALSAKIETNKLLHCYVLSPITINILLYFTYVGTAIVYEPLWFSVHFHCLCLLWQKPGIQYLVALMWSSILA